MADHKPNHRHHRRHPQRGAATLEYIVLGVVLVLGLVAGVSYLRGKVNTSLGNTGTKIESVSNDGEARAPGDNPNSPAPVNP